MSNHGIDDQGRGVGGDETAQSSSGRRRLEPCYDLGAELPRDGVLSFRVPGGDGAAPAVCCRAVGWCDPDRFWLRLAWPGYFEDSVGLCEQGADEEQPGHHGGLYCLDVEPLFVDLSGWLL